MSQDCLGIFCKKVLFSLALNVRHWEEGLLFGFSGERLEPVLGTVLRKMTGKLAKKKRRLRGNQYCLDAKNIKYCEDGVHLLFFFVDERRLSVAQRHQDHVKQVPISVGFGIFAATSEQINRFEIYRDTPGPEVRDLYDSSISTLK